jgi:2-polyprenyl-3-methyl-5-hydroxy-6-metoxy-1,4-benzoquinol methylase
MLGDVTGLSILDAGCGEGDYCRELSEKGARVTGIDLSPGLIAEAKRKQAHLKRGARYDVGSITDMKGLYADQSFDRLISLMTLMDSPA